MERGDKKEGRKKYHRIDWNDVMSGVLWGVLENAMRREEEKRWRKRSEESEKRDK